MILQYCLLKRIKVHGEEELTFSEAMSPENGKKFLREKNQEAGVKARESGLM
jgi:hypothetical protein